MTFDASQSIRLAIETLDIEAAALLGLKPRINQSFQQIVEKILDVRPPR